MKKLWLTISLLGLASSISAYNLNNPTKDELANLFAEALEAFTPGKTRSLTQKIAGKPHISQEQARVLFKDALDKLPGGTSQAEVDKLKTTVKQQKDDLDTLIAQISSVKKTVDKDTGLSTIAKHVQTISDKVKRMLQSLVS